MSPRIVPQLKRIEWCLTSMEFSWYRQSGVHLDTGFKGFTGFTGFTASWALCQGGNDHVVAATRHCNTMLRAKRFRQFSLDRRFARKISSKKAECNLVSSHRFARGTLLTGLAFGAFYLKLSVTLLWSAERLKAVSDSKGTQS